MQAVREHDSSRMEGNVTPSLGLGALGTELDIPRGPGRLEDLLFRTCFKPHLPQTYPTPRELASLLLNGNFQWIKFQVRT